MVEPEIIYEDKNFLAVNKPAGLLVHPTSNSEELTLVDWLLRKYPEIRNVGDDTLRRPGIVHRLDKATSGLMLIPRTQAYFEYLKSLFQTHEIKKIYLAILIGKLYPKKGIIDKPIALKPGTTKRTVHFGKMEKSARTAYEVKKYFSAPLYRTESPLPGSSPEGFFSLVEVIPETGRTHQIRVHCASVGHPVAGDLLYGPKRQPEWADRLMLHARSLEFPLAPGRRLRIEAPEPEEFRVATLREYPQK